MAFVQKVAARFQICPNVIVRDGLKNVTSMASSLSVGFIVVTIISCFTVFSSSLVKSTILLTCVDTFEVKQICVSCPKTGYSLKFPWFMHVYPMVITIWSPILSPCYLFINGYPPFFSMKLAITGKLQAPARRIVASTGSSGRHLLSPRRSWRQERGSRGWMTPTRFFFENNGKIWETP